MSGETHGLRRGLLEALAIVGSILLAFAIDAAWEDRTEAREGLEILNGIQSEFEFHRAELHRFRDRWVAVRRSTERLVIATATDVAPAPVAMDSLLLEFLNPATFDPRGGALDAAIGSGRIGLVGSRELRAQLAGWDGVVAELRDNELAMRAFILQTIVPFLAERGVPLPRAWALLADAGLVAARGRPSWPAPVATDTEAARIYQTLVADPEFEVLVGNRYTWINVEEYEDAISFVDSLLAQLQDELDR